MRTHFKFLLGGAALAASTAVAQNSASTSAAESGSGGWVAPGTKGSPIDGTLFHAQVMMSAHGFSPGVIDGQKGESFRLALRSFQESRGLDVSGELDPATRRALLESNRPSTIMVELGPDDVRGQYILPFPGDPEAQAELKFLGYRNM
ncbi:MAG: peptidoglycan-binding domain-containing protein, partial [Sphingomicrobium sp.]